MAPSEPSLKKTASADRPTGRKVLAVSSGGGHWVELLRIVPALEGHDVVFVTVDNMYRSEVGLSKFYAVPDVTRWNKWRWALTLAKLTWIILRERPSVIVSTGALPGYFALRLGRLLGVRTIWLDSIANAEELSMSGQMAGRYADLWLTQWPHLAKSEGPFYRGTVL